MRSGNVESDATEVIASDKRLDAMEAELEQSAIEVMALRQPMASDLRNVVAALKISSTLERIGDLAKNIAKRIAKGELPEGREVQGMQLVHYDPKSKRHIPTRGSSFLYVTREQGLGVITN